MSTAKIYSYTVLHTASVEFRDYTPFACAIVEQEDGSRVAGRLEGYEAGAQIVIGQTVYPAIGGTDARIFTIQPCVKGENEN